jgi:hypothetical protein
MVIYDTLKRAIELHHCVRIRAGGFVRRVCPVAIGIKDSQQKLLAYQYAGESASGIAPEGGWRCFPLRDIIGAEMIGDPWHATGIAVTKVEASFDQILCGMGAQRPVYDHLKRPPAQ